MWVCIGPPHGGAGQRRGGRCLRAAFSSVRGGVVARRGELQDEPGPGAAVGFYQKALPVLIQVTRDWVSVSNWDSKVESRLLLLLSIPARVASNW